MNIERAAVHWYAHGARYYDPQLALWHTSDPLAELYSGYSPYHYVANNPVNYIDPNGMSQMSSQVHNQLDIENGRGNYNWEMANKMAGMMGSQFGGTSGGKEYSGNTGSGIEVGTQFDWRTGKTYKVFEDPMTGERYYRKQTGTRGWDFDDGSELGAACGSPIYSYYSLPSLDHPLMDHYGDKNFGTLDNFISEYDGWTLREVISQQNTTTRLNSSSEGPYLRYIEDPVTGYVIDLKHMLMVGDAGPGAGFFVELFQLVTDRSSAFNLQDSFSNQLGYDFFFHYGSRINEEPDRFMEFFIRFLQNPDLRGWNKF